MPEAELLVDAKQDGDDGGEVEEVKGQANAESDEHGVAEEVAWLIGRDGSQLVGADELGVGED